nr:hypothetical protein [Candidatus Sigynarchaeota archaeon]
MNAKKSKKKPSRKQIASKDAKKGTITQRFINYIMDTLQKNKADVLKDLDNSTNESGKDSKIYITTKNMIDNYDPWKFVIVENDFFYIPINNTGEYDFGIGLRFENYLEMGDGNFAEGTFTVFGVARKSGKVKKVMLKEQCRTGGKSGVVGGLFALSNIISLKLSMDNPIGGGSIFFQIIPHAIETIHEALDKLEIHDDLVDRSFASICIKDLNATISHINENANDIEFDNYAFGAILFNIFPMDLTVDEYTKILALILRTDFEPRFKIIMEIPDFAHANFWGRENVFGSNIDLITRLLKSKSFEQGSASFAGDVWSIAKMFSAISSKMTNPPLENTLHVDFKNFISILYPRLEFQNALEMVMTDIPRIFKIFSRDEMLAHEVFNMLREQLRQSLDVAARNNTWGLFQDDQIDAILQKVLDLPLHSTDISSMLALMIDKKYERLYDGRMSHISRLARRLDCFESQSFSSDLADNVLDFGAIACKLLNWKGTSLDFPGYLQHVASIIILLRDAVRDERQIGQLVSELDATGFEFDNNQQISLLIQLSLQVLLANIVKEYKGSRLQEYQLNRFLVAKNKLQEISWREINATVSQFVAISGYYRLYAPVGNAETLLMLVQYLGNSLLNSRLSKEKALDFIEILFDKRVLRAFISMARSSRSRLDWDSINKDIFALFMLLVGCYTGNDQFPLEDAVKDFLSGLLALLGESSGKEAFFEKMIDLTTRFRAKIKSLRSVYPITPLILGIHMALNYAGIGNQVKYTPMKQFLLDSFGDVIDEIKRDERRVASLRTYIFQDRHLSTLGYYSSFPMYTDFYGRDIDLYAIFNTLKNVIAFQMDSQDIARFMDSFRETGLLDNEMFLQFVAREGFFWSLNRHADWNREAESVIRKIFQFTLQLKKMASPSVEFIKNKPFFDAIVTLGVVPDYKNRIQELIAPAIHESLELILREMGDAQGAKNISIMKEKPSIYSMLLDTPDLLVELLVTTSKATIKNGRLEFRNVYSFLEKKCCGQPAPPYSDGMAESTLGEVAKAIIQVLEVDPNLPFSFTAYDFTSSQHATYYFEPRAHITEMIEFLNVVNDNPSWREAIRLYLYKNLHHSIMKKDVSTIKDNISKLEGHPYFRKGLKQTVAACVYARYIIEDFGGRTRNYFNKVLGLKTFIANPEVGMKDLKERLTRDIEETRREMADPGRNFGSDDPCSKLQVFRFLKDYLFGDTHVAGVDADIS